MINWIIENKEWIFSGIGVLVISLILNFLFRRGNAKQIQKGGENSKNYQSSGNMTINEK